MALEELNKETFSACRITQKINSRTHDFSSMADWLERPIGIYIFWKVVGSSPIGELYFLSNSI